MRPRGPWLLLLVTPACAADVDTVGAPTEPFIALARDLDGFRAWPAVVIEPAAIDLGHADGPSRIYLRGDAPAEDEPFAVGTVVVKTVELGAPPDWEIHAMVKRGGGYNPRGARGWEYLDLVLTEDGAPVIAWRGAGDAADPGGYVHDGEVVPCNDCHGYAWRRDYVFSLPALAALRETPP